MDPTEREEIDDAAWYFDGSMINGRWRALRLTGFGVAVATPGGDLLGYGLGWPPTWVTTAAAAEAWALSVVLELVPFPPPLRTDCLALLQTAREGTSKAIHHSKPLARIWKRIANTIGDDVSLLMNDDTLVWFPAHHTWRSVGEVKGSNGRRLSPVDWRANRLVDKLAKTAAAALQHPKHVLELLPSADAAAAHAACLLGVVTHAANHHEVTETDDTGCSRTIVCRDSTDKPRSAKRSYSEPARMGGKHTVAHKSTEAGSKAVAPWRPPTAGAVARQVDSEQLERRVADIGSTLRASSAGPAQVRLAQLRQRVLAKSSL